MKQFIALLLGLVLLWGCAGRKFSKQQDKGEYKAVQRLIENKDFFSARDRAQANLHRLRTYHSLVINASIDNAFNRPQQSNSNIDLILTGHAAKLTDSVRLELLKLKQANHARLFEYDKAAMVTNEIIHKYSAILKEEDIADYRNTGNIWHALKGQPKQELIISGDTRMKMIRDKVNLTNLEVSAGGALTGFIFDTGANISTVTKSTAEKFNMVMLDAKIEVGAITGAKVNSGLAVCPEMRIGNITVKNAVFLVFEDKDLAFPQIDYQIHGILGFPVIEAMKEVQITTTDEFIVPETQSSYEKQNMALDFLTPVIQIEGGYYTFDTGAAATSLYRKYFEKHKAEIEASYSQTELHLGGAGGMKTFKGYKITFSPVINNRQLTIENVQLHTEKIDEKDDLYYGNIGQDLIKQFSKMTINFESMFIKFD